MQELTRLFGVEIRFLFQQDQGFEMGQVEAFDPLLATRWARIPSIWRYCFQS